MTGFSWPTLPWIRVVLLAVRPCHLSLMPPSEYPLSPPVPSFSPVYCSENVLTRWKPNFDPISPQRQLFFFFNRVQVISNISLINNSAAYGKENGS